MTPGVCDECHQVMMDADGCVGKLLSLNGKDYAPIPYGFELYWQGNRAEVPGRCHDCNAKVGEYHHLECDVEECPRCGGQLLSCDCVDTYDGSTWVARQLKAGRYRIISAD